MSKYTILLIILFSFSKSLNSQSINRITLIEKLCQKWIIDSIEVIDFKKKFIAPNNIKSNFMIYNLNGTFKSQEFEIVINGKWKIDEKKMQIINFDHDNLELKGEIIFNIIELTNSNLSITSIPMSGGKIIMHFKSFFN